AILECSTDGNHALDEHRPLNSRGQRFARIPGRVSAGLLGPRHAFAKRQNVATEPSAQSSAGHAFGSASEDSASHAAGDTPQSPVRLSIFLVRDTLRPRLGFRALRLLLGDLLGLDQRILLAQGPMLSAMRLRNRRSE